MYKILSFFVYNYIFSCPLFFSLIFVVVIFCFCFCLRSAVVRARLLSRPAPARMRPRPHTPYSHKDHATYFTTSGQISAAKKIFSNISTCYFFVFWHTNTTNFFAFFVPKSCFLIHLIFFKAPDNFIKIIIKIISQVSKEKSHRSQQHF